MHSRSSETPLEMVRKSLRAGWRDAWLTYILYIHIHYISIHFIYPYIHLYIHYPYIYISNYPFYIYPFIYPMVKAWSELSNRLMMVPLQKTQLQYYLVS